MPANSPYAVPLVRIGRNLRVPLADKANASGWAFEKASTIRADIWINVKKLAGSDVVSAHFAATI